MEWFSDITGCSEPEFRSLLSRIISVTDKGRVKIRNVKTGRIYDAGKFMISDIKTLRKISLLKMETKENRITPLAILADTDVKDIQEKENSKSLFQVASNFSGLESESEYSFPSENNQTFTEKYWQDKTQGPVASISAGAGAISRVYTAFYNPKTPCETWRQRPEKQINFLDNLQKYFPVKNGYVVYEEKSVIFPFVSKDVFKYGKIGIQFDTEVVKTGNKINQVFCSTIDRLVNSHLTSEMFKKRSIFLLKVAYEGTYMAGICLGIKRLYLTLIGGGVFDNDENIIYTALINAHKKYGFMYDNVTVIIHGKKISKAFNAMLKRHEIDIKWLKSTGMLC
jgi:hypothetical protein